MAISDESPGTLPDRRRWPSRLVVSEMWASLAITAMWLAVVFAAVFGPDIVTTSSGGSDGARIPSAIVVALFACLATRPVAKYGFGRPKNDPD